MQDKGDFSCRAASKQAHSTDMVVGRDKLTFPDREAYPGQQRGLDSNPSQPSHDPI